MDPEMDLNMAKFRDTNECVSRGDLRYEVDKKKQDRNDRFIDPGARSCWSGC